MTLILKDRVKETSTSSGIDPFVLIGAVSGFQTFEAIGDGNTTYYTAQYQSEWEVGIGTYDLATTTLTRDTILSSSNNGAAVNFPPGTKEVFVCYPSEKAVYTEGIAGGTTPTDGQLLIGNGAGFSLATLTAGSNISVTNSAGGITIDTIGAGTVTSVGLSAPAFLSVSGSPVTTTGTLALSYSGTALPVANGGTGITAFGTGVATALGVNVGSAGAFVTYNGAGGTPSAITLTNGTGLPLTTGVTGTLGVTNGGTGTATQFTSGSVVFAGGSGVYTQDNNNLFWDDSNNRLGIRTSASPQAALHVVDATLRAPSTTFNAASATLLTNESVQLAWGVDGTSPFGAWLQTRASSNLGYNLHINPLGGQVNIGTRTAQPGYQLYVSGSFGFSPGTSVVPVNNGEVTIYPVNNTALRLSYKGTDGTVRSNTLTLT